MRRFRVSFAALAALASVATPAAAATIAATTSVNVVKPVQLMKLQDMDFGTLTFSGFSGTRAITINQAGTFACAANIVCSGAPKPARFNVQGFNKMTAGITVTSGTLSNGIDSIPFAPDAPTSVYLPNSGAPGVDFNIGGTLTVSSTLVGGTYTGTINVTADYQ